MKSLPAGLKDFLHSGETTMVHCWKVTRNDGVVQGFTEHDLDLTFNSVTYKAATGFTASQIESSLGLSVDNLSAEGALDSETISEDTLASGRYDDALVELYWVNFEDVSQRILLNKGNIGRIERGELAFIAELRSQTQRLQQTTGRCYQRTCDTTFGDERCKADVRKFRETSKIVKVIEDRYFLVSGLIYGSEDGYYSLGVLEFTSGHNHKLRFEIKKHDGNGVTLWEAPAFPVAVGDNIIVTAGCDKRIETCHFKFNNTSNFQGFNLIPGNDYISLQADRGGNNDGGSIFHGH